MHLSVKKISKTACSFAIVVAVCMVYVSSQSMLVHAQAGGGGNSGTGLTNPMTNVETIGDLVKSGLTVFSYIAVIFAVVMLIVVGLQYILARGNPTEMKKHSDWLMFIIIGLAIVIGARIAVDIVINTMNTTGVIDPGIMGAIKEANTP